MKNDVVGLNTYVEISVYNVDHRQIYYRSITNVLWLNLMQNFLHIQQIILTILHSRYYKIYNYYVYYVFNNSSNVEATRTPSWFFVHHQCYQPHDVQDPHHVHHAFHGTASKTKFIQYMLYSTYKINNLVVCYSYILYYDTF